MNKNTKQKRITIAALSRKGERGDIAFEVPVKDYHNASKTSLRTIRIPTAVPNGDGIISDSPRRNMQMVVFRNKNAAGQGDTMTRHIPIADTRFVTPKNHAYLEYRQPAGAR